MTGRVRFWPSGQDGLQTCPDSARQAANFSDTFPVTLASLRARAGAPNVLPPSGIPPFNPPAYHSHIARTHGAIHRDSRWTPNDRGRGSSPRCSGRRCISRPATSRTNSTAPSG
ncbi:hypothetical protein F01_420069 [Burkholderia cenocepacia]|nr:hypothetical protein F01_420069 [Burkholderia cenocepacia]